MNRLADIEERWSHDDVPDVPWLIAEVKRLLDNDRLTRLVDEFPNARPDTAEAPARGLTLRTTRGC